MRQCLRDKILLSDLLGMGSLMMKVMGGIASEEEKIDFATLWQNRVERILFHNKNGATLVTVSHIKR